MLKNFRTRRTKDEPAATAKAAADDEPSLIGAGKGPLQFKQVILFPSFGPSWICFGPFCFVLFCFIFLFFRERGANGNLPGLS
jgi:hypothetical protein